MSTDLSNINLILYIIAWLLTYLIYKNKNKSFSVVSLILLTELSLSVISAFLYNDPLSYVKDIKLFPFIYLFSLTIISILPLVKVPYARINAIQKPSNLLINTFCICFIFAAVLQLPSTIMNFKSGVVTMMMDVSLGADMYSEHLSNADSVGDGAISNLPSIITNTFGDIAIFFSLYYISLKQKNRIFTIGLIISILVLLVQPISSGMRGQTVLRIISIITSYVILYKFYDDKLNKIVKIVLLVSLIAISLPIVAITVSRFGERDGGSLYSVTSYLGQANLNFNNYVLDSNGIRYGDRTANLFKSLFVDNVPENFVERRMKYPHMKISDETYSTYVGDIVLDYGPFSAPVLFIIFSLLISKSLRRVGDVIPFHKLLLIYFVACVMMQGSFYLFPYSDVGGNLALIAYFLMYMVFRYDYKQKIKINKYDSCNCIISASIPPNSGK